MREPDLKLTWVYLFIAGALCLILNLTGLDFIVPGAGVRDIVFENAGNVEDNLFTLVEERQIIRDMVVTAWTEYGEDYETKKQIPFMYNRKEIQMERNVVNGMRSYLLRTMAPDEGVLTTLERMNPEKLKFNPHYFGYGGFYIYSGGLYLSALKFMKIINLRRDIGYYLLHPAEMGKIFISLRFVNTLVALGSFILIFLIGCRLRGRWHGILASMLFVVIPGVVIWNHFARPHVFMLFWILLAVYFFIRTVQSKDSEMKNFIPACIFTGVAASILIPYGVLMLLMVPLTVFLKDGCNKSDFTLKHGVKKCLLGFLIFIGIFILFNPYFLLSLKEVFIEYQYSLRDIKSEPSLQNYFYYLTGVLKIHMGIFLWVLCLLSVIVSLYRPRKEEWLILFPFLAGFLLFGMSTPMYLMRFVFFMPFAALIIGNGIVKLAEVKKISLAVLSVFGMCMVYTFLYTAAYLSLFRGEDVRYTAGKWVNANLPEGASIGLNEAPVAFRTPPFSFAKFRITVIDDITNFGEALPDFFVTSSFDWRYSSYKIIKNHLSDYYELKTFERIPSVFGMSFKTGVKDPPPDYCYFNPTVIIWKLKKR